MKAQGISAGKRRKPRGDAKLASLPEERQAEIGVYGHQHTIAQTAKWLKESGIEICRSSISRFLSGYRLGEQLERNAGLVEGILNIMAKAEKKMPAKQLRRYGQSFFTQMALDQQDKQGWYLTEQLALRQDKMELEWKKYRDRVKERKEAIEREIEKAKLNGGIRPETLEEIEKELRLM